MNNKTKENLNKQLEERKHILQFRSGRFRIEKDNIFTVFDETGQIELFSSNEPIFELHTNGNENIYYLVVDYYSSKLGLCDYNFNLIMPMKYSKIYPQSCGGFVAEQEIDDLYVWDFYDELGHNLTNAHYQAIEKYDSLGNEYDLAYNKVDIHHYKGIKNWYYDAENFNPKNLKEQYNKKHNILIKKIKK